MTSQHQSSNLEPDRFAAAVSLAAQLHYGQTKKTGAPYLSHLLEVCALALRAGGDPDQGIAALLHDAPEKSGGRETLRQIESEFGLRVAAIVRDCTDSFHGEPKPDWLTLKRQQVERFRKTAIAASTLVYSADKLANGLEIQRRLNIEGPTIWLDYGGGRDGHLWYFRAMYEVFRERDPKNPLLPELDAVLQAIETSS